MNRVYEFEPIPDKVGADSTYILGGQGNLWAEAVPTFRQVEYMLWPRSFALAEVLWSPKHKKNWDKFIDKTEIHLDRLEKADINHAVSFYDPIVKSSKNANGDLEVQLTSEVNDVKMYYTFNFTYPDHHYPLYKKGEKLIIPRDALKFSVVSYRNGKQVGKRLTFPIEVLNKRSGAK